LPTRRCLAYGRTSEAIEIGDGEASMLGFSRQRVNNAPGSSLRGPYLAIGIRCSGHQGEYRSPPIPTPARSRCRTARAGGPECRGWSRDDLLIESGEPALILGDQRRLEAALPIAGRGVPILDLEDRSLRGLERRHRAT
jgi:hypothetical protein